MAASDLFRTICEIRTGSHGDADCQLSETIADDRYHRLLRDFIATIDDGDREKLWDELEDRIDEETMGELRTLMPEPIYCDLGNADGTYLDLPEMRDVVQYVLTPMLVDPARELFRILCDVRMDWDRTVLGQTIADSRYSALLEEYLGGLRQFPWNIDYLWGELCDDNKKKVMVELRFRHAAFDRMTVEPDSDDADYDYDDADDAVE